jgi:hypothetical protein
MRPPTHAGLLRERGDLPRARQRLDEAMRHFVIQGDERGQADVFLRLAHPS